MIVAFEGVDRTGKTTCFEEVRRRMDGRLFRWVPSFPGSAEAKGCMSHVEARQAYLWDCLYDKHQLYVCDRSVFVSAPVYSAVLDRECLVDWRRWTERVRVLYFYAPVAELRRRYAQLGEDSYLHSTKLEEALAAYKYVVPEFRCVYMDACAPRAELADRAVEEVLNCA